MSGLPRSHTRAQLVGGVLAAVFGLGLTAGVLAVMNGAIAPPRDRGDAAVVAFDVPPEKKPPPAKPKPKPKPERKRSAAPPMPALTAGLAGLDFGLPQFQGGLDDATQALLGDVGDVVMTEDSVDVAPRPAARVAPEFPTRARKDFITGYVTLSLLVGADGRVEDVRVLEAQPRGVFEEAAIAALRQWRFQPAMYQGRPVPVRARQTLRFELE
ncbi:MAG: energy transducer TonB [Alphaproteobacteria bacterium]|nr:energy transducer TonB [Alphaproteobacteria bacterium]